MSGTYQVHHLRLSFHNFINHTYIIVDRATRRAAIVDPAWDLRRVQSALAELEAELEAILLTHSHYDHVNLVDPLVRLYNPRVFMSWEEISYYNYRCPNLVAIRHGEVIEIGQTRAISLLTPGHTYGSMCYLLEDSLFTGDTVFVEGCGICTCRGGSADRMYESIQAIKREVPHHVRVYPGHSYGKQPGCTLSQLLRENIYFQLDNRQHFVAFRNRPNQKGWFEMT